MYKTAANKREIVDILADLTDSDVETIAEILGDHGLYEAEARCSRCGKKFPRIKKPYCRECETKLFRQQAEQEAHRKWVRYQVRQNAQRINRLEVQIAAIKQESQRLLDELG